MTETLTLDRTAGQSTLFAFTHGRGVWKLALPGSGPGCQYSLSSQSFTAPVLGGVLPVNVATDSSCSWSALSNDPWGLVESPAGGKGPGIFNINVAQNQTAQIRTTAVQVQNQTIAISQDPASAVSGNDELASAFSIPQLPWLGVQDTTGASENTTDPVHSCTGSADYKSVWFSFTAPQTGTVRFSFKVQRQDKFGDAGSVLTACPLTAGTLGTQLACSVTPISDVVLTTRFPQFNVVQGNTYSVEVSSTLSGAPPDATPLGGTLVLTAQMLP